MEDFFKTLRQYFRAVYNRLRGIQDFFLTPYNSGLQQRQIDTGIKALKILGIEEALIAKQDLVIFLYAVGLNPTDDVIDSKLRAFKLHESEQYTFGEVCHIWQSMLQDLTDEEDILKRAFLFFDKDGNGEISVPELRTTMHELGDLLSEEEIQAFMAVMDVNNDGVIGFQEFIDTLKTQTTELIPAGKPHDQTQHEAEVRRPANLGGEDDDMPGPPSAQNAPPQALGESTSYMPEGKWRMVYDTPSCLNSERYDPALVEQKADGPLDSCHNHNMVSVSVSRQRLRPEEGVASAHLEPHFYQGKPSVVRPVLMVGDE